jgi:mannosyltransferase OCH1-like enzyme
MGKLGYVAHQSDVIRLEALWEYGGVYLDFDMLALANIESALDWVRAGASLDKGGCNNAIVAATPKHPWVRWQLDRIDAIAKRGEAQPGPWGGEMHGPWVLQEANKALPEEVTLWNHRLFHPFYCDEQWQVFPETLAVHLWSSCNDRLLNTPHWRRHWEPLVYGTAATTTEARHQGAGRGILAPTARGQPKGKRERAR